MARQLGWDGRHLRILEIAGLLHDFGKIGVPDHILLKPQKLNPDEADLMSTHRRIGAGILQACRLDKEVVQIVRDCDMDFDSAGDGARREGPDIHLGARILAVADAYDSLTHDQVFRTGKPHAEAMKSLQADAGSRFDGNVVSALARWVEKQGLAAVMGEMAAIDQVTASGPHSFEAAHEAGSLCHIFSYLYVLETLYDGFFVLDSDLRFAVWSAGAEQLLGRSASQMLGQVWTSRQLSYRNRAGKPLTDDECPIHEVLSTSSPACRTLQVNRKRGGWAEVELQAFPLLDHNNSLQGVAEIFREISPRNRRAPQIRESNPAAGQDPLTGVANRSELETHLNRLFAEYDGDPDKTLGVLALEIDHFQGLVETYGYSFADRVVMTVAQVLQSELSSGELIARSGREEFVVVVPAADLSATVRIAERLRATLTEATIGEVEQLKITGSFGVAQREAGDATEDLLHRAHAALESARQRGRNRTAQLARADLDHDASDSQAVSPANQKEFVFQSTFTTCMLADMAVYKVGGFVREAKAQVKEVSEARVVVRLGDCGIFRRWGATDDRRSVVVELDIGEPQESSAKAATKRVPITVTVRPIGRPPSREDFEGRAKRVTELVRSYFAAD
jgi:diguanylate cyclase (GGDEF)-like protein